MAEPVVYLKPRRAKPFFLRHPWVFSGAVGRVEGSPEKGGVVIVRDADGRFIARGFYNATSQIIVRLMSWLPDEALDDAFLARRLDAALRLRSDVLRLPDRTSAYRLLFSESDGLPGLIVDRYGDWLVTQFLTAGMSARREPLLNMLQERLSPRGIFNRSDDEAGEKEGMEVPHGALRGEAPPEALEITTDGMKFLVDMAGGQKTGFFLDQRENRSAAAGYLRGRSVLDLFCYTGAFSVAAVKLGGAGPVLALDRSAPALELARKNFELNGIAGVETREAQASEAARALRRENRRFGAVIIDPPKFARSGSGVERALRAYRDLNLQAVNLLEDDGILVTCSCSGHVAPEQFFQMLNESAGEAGAALQILERRGQSPDHPVIASCPETAYLKCFICRVVR